MDPPTTSTATLDAVRTAFETAVRERSTRRNDPHFAVGYYISLDLLQALAARVAAQHDTHPIKRASLHRAVQIRSNARLFKRSSLEMHARVVNALLLPQTDTRQQRQSFSTAERQHLLQITKHASDPAFCERLLCIASGGTELLVSLQQLIAAAVAQHTRPRVVTQVVYTNAIAHTTNIRMAAADCNSKRTITSVAHDSSTDKQHAKLQLLLHAASPSHKPPPATTKQTTPPTRHKQFPLRQLQNATICDLRNPSSLQRAYTIHKRQPARFTAYCTFFANDSMHLATAIARQCCTKRSAAAICAWISTTIGPLPLQLPIESIETRSPCVSSSRLPLASTITTTDLRSLTLVAAALTVYGEHVLSALFDRDASMGGVRDIPLLADDLRVTRSQRTCLQRARWPAPATTAATRRQQSTRSKLHAAHYLPLSLTIQWNNTLAPAERLDVAALRWILNHPVNLRAVPHRVNLRDHRRVEHLLAAFIHQVDSSDNVQLPIRLQQLSWLAWRNARDRLAHIAARIQSLELQSAIERTDGGTALLAQIRSTFEAIEQVLAMRGFVFGAIWQQQQQSLKRINSRRRGIN